jgi:hypothetical protein
LKNYDVSQKRHESIWNHAALSEDVFNRQFSAMGHDVIWALRELKILDFTARTTEYYKDSPEVVSLVKTLRSRNDIQLALRISQVEPETVDGEERLRIVSGLLKYVGYKSKYTEKKKIKTDNGVIEYRHYRVVPIGTPSASATPAPACDISHASALRELKILDFADSTTRYHKDSPEVVSLVKALRSRNDIQLALCIAQVEPETDEGEERLRIFREVLKYAGYKTKYSKKIEIETDKGVVELNSYKVVPIDTPPLTSATPPLIINKPGGCGGSSELSDSTSSSQFDLLAARQAILSCIEYKFTTWMESDKSQVSWEIEEMSEVSLSAIANEAEELACQEKAVEDQQQTELNKTILEMQLSHSATDSLFVYSQEKSSLPDIEVGYQPEKEEIEFVARFLADCESAEMVAELRQCIPQAVLKAAAKGLEAGKRRQIREWVLVLNSSP